MKTRTAIAIASGIARAIRRAWPQVHHALDLRAAVLDAESDGGREVTDAEIVAIVYDLLDSLKPVIARRVLRRAGRPHEVLPEPAALHGVPAGGVVS